MDHKPILDSRSRHQVSQETFPSDEEVAEPQYVRAEPRGHCSHCLTFGFSLGSPSTWTGQAGLEEQCPELILLG